MLARDYGSPNRPAPDGRERLTVDATAGGVSLTKPAGAKYANMRLESGQVRFTLDGSTAPTSSIGRLLEVGEVIELESKEEIANFAAIRTGGIRSKSTSRSTTTRSGGSLRRRATARATGEWTSSRISASLTRYGRADRRTRTCTTRPC